MKNSNRFFVFFSLYLLINFNVKSQNSEKDFPIILQENPLDCGPVCLAMIAQFHDKEFSIEQLSFWSKLDSTGTSLLGLSDAADSLNFKTLAVRIPFHYLLKDAPLPAIVHWNGNHFVVVYKANSNKIWVADPAYGKRIYTKEVFLKYWLNDSKSKNQEGIVLLLEQKERGFQRN